MAATFLKEHKQLKAPKSYSQRITAQNLDATNFSEVRMSEASV